MPIRKMRTATAQKFVPKEAAPLTIALSLDGLAVGFGAALSDVNPYSSHSVFP